MSSERRDLAFILHDVFDVMTNSFVHISTNKMVENRPCFFAQGRNGESQMVGGKNPLKGSKVNIKVGIF